VTPATGIIKEAV